MAKNKVLAYALKNLAVRNLTVVAKETHKPAGDENWDNKTPAFQEQYLKDHPH